MLPFPPDNGTKIPTYHRLKNLSKNNNVTMLCIHSENIKDGYIKEIEKYCSLFLIKIQRPLDTSKFRIKMFNYIKSLQKNIPKYIFENYCKEAEEWIKNQIELKNFDVIEASEGDIGIYLKNNLKAYKILICHSVMVENIKKQINFEKNIINKIKLLGHWLSWYRYERWLYAQVDLCVPLTKKLEREILSLKTNSIVKNCLTNGVDLEYFSYNYSKETPSGICFVGLMNYNSNVDAVLYFYKEIFPTLKVAKKDIKFYIVGSSPASEIQKLSKDNNVVVTGYVNDIRPIIRKAGIVIVPNRIGGGILNKILEPLSMGVPVVTNSNSVEDLNVRNREELIIADSYNAFADSIMELIINNSLRLKLSRNGREYVEKNHNWENIISHYEQVIKSNVGVK